MAQSSLDLSLDEIIKENKARNKDGSSNRGGRGTPRGTIRGRGRGRGRGAGPVRGRGSSSAVRGGGVSKRGTPRGRGSLILRGRGSSIGRGRGAPIGRGRGASIGRGRGLPRGRGIIRGRGGGLQRQSRSRTPGQQPNGARRSVSRGRYTQNNPNQQQQGSRSRSRSRSRINFDNLNAQRNPLSRSRSRSRNRLQNNNANQIPRGRSRSRSQSGFNAPQAGRRSRSRTPSRNFNIVPKTGIAARLGNNQQFAFSKVGLRSDMILNSRQNQIKSQTFTRSARSGSVPKLQESYTVSVANDRMRRRPLNRQRRNSFSIGNNQQGFFDPNINNLTESIMGVNLSARSGGLSSISSNRSIRSLQSSRGRPRGRGRGRGSLNYVNKQILDPQLQMEIAALQGKNFQDGKILAASSDPTGINFIPTPHLTTTKLSDRFNCL